MLTIARAINPRGDKRGEGEFIFWDEAWEVLTSKIFREQKKSEYGQD